MNKSWVFTIIVIAVLGSIFTFFIYNYNKEFSAEQAKHQQDIGTLKSEQEGINKEFDIGQQQKTIQQQQEQITTLQKDEDGDGLTYQQEVQLGTDDNEVDSDGDGIWDGEDRHPAGGGSQYTVTVPWIHDGLHYSTQFGIHEDKYWYYKSQERGGCCDGWEKFATPNDPTIQTIAKDVVDVYLATKDPCPACIAINFVSSMIYEYDIEYIGLDEYPKYAIETIIDGKGDCEDTSFLMASILEAVGIDTILLLYPGHMAVGVECGSCTGTSYNYKGKNYFFLETTGYEDNWQIGQAWGKFVYEIPTVIEV